MHNIISLMTYLTVTLCVRLCYGYSSSGLDNFAHHQVALPFGVIFPVPWRVSLATAILWLDEYEQKDCTSCKSRGFTSYCDSLSICLLTST